MSLLRTLGLASLGILWTWLLADGLGWVIDHLLGQARRAVHVPWLLASGVLRRLK